MSLVEAQTDLSLLPGCEHLNSSGRGRGSEGGEPKNSASPFPEVNVGVQEEVLQGNSVFVCESRHLFSFSALRSWQLISAPDQASPAALAVEGMNSRCVPLVDQKAQQKRSLELLILNAAVHLTPFKYAA